MTASNASTQTNARISAERGAWPHDSESVTARTSLGNYALRTAGYAFSGSRLRRLMAADVMPRDELLRLQERKLGRLLRHAKETVPFYAEILADTDIGDDDRRPLETLQQMPFLTKRDISANFPDRILSRGRRAFGSQHLYSSGTTADRIDVIVGPWGQLSRLGLVLWRHRLGGSCPIATRRVEIPPDACSRICGANRDRPPGFAEEVRWLVDQGEGRLKAGLKTADRRLRAAIRHGLIYDETLPPFGPEGTAIRDESLQTYIDAIREARPHLLAGLPTYLHQLARFMHRSGQRLHVPVIHPMGALSTEHQRRLIADAFGGRLYDTYGSSELGTFSSQCAEQIHLHVAMSSYIVEVVSDGRPARDGELGHIAVTSLDNRSMPLIRYLLGDVGRRYTSDCACGRTSDQIECNGRLQSLIITSAGKPVTEEEVMDLAYDDLGLEHFQLVEHRPGEFDLMVVPEPGKEIDRTTVSDAFAELLDNPRQLECFPVNSIYPEPTGKYRFVKSASWERFT